MLEYFFVFIIGLFIGSFLNCVVWRIYNKESFLKGNSKCPHCLHKLSASDLVPLLSYAVLNGKCRYCGKSISSQYPLVEIFTGLIFLLVFYALGAPVVFGVHFLELLFYLVISSYFIMIFLFDFRWYIIPDGLTFSGIAITILWLFLGTFGMHIYTETDFLMRFIVAFCVFLIFFALWFFSSGKAMGFGDVKLVILLGLLLGWPQILPAMFISFSVGALVGIVAIILKRKKMKSQIPFGPFLVLGSFIGIFWGEQIFNWYLGLI